jgi:hypothetical protein
LKRLEGRARGSVRGVLTKSPDRGCVLRGPAAAPKYRQNPSYSRNPSSSKIDSSNSFFFWAIRPRDAPVDHHPARHA